MGVLAMMFKSPTGVDIGVIAFMRRFTMGLLEHIKNTHNKIRLPQITFVYLQGK